MFVSRQTHRFISQLKPSSLATPPISFKSLDRITSLSSKTQVKPPVYTAPFDSTYKQAPFDVVDTLVSFNTIESNSTASDRHSRSLGLSLRDRQMFVFNYEVNVNATRNNTLITFCTKEGLVKFRASSGTCGLKKAARGTSDAGYQAALQALQKATARGITAPSVHLKMNGFGPGRDQAFRALISGDWVIRRISDVTPIRFGGCRAKKKRRL